MKIGFIGLGNLGLPIAQNILALTSQLNVYNRTASKTQHLLESGATHFDSVSALAAASDIVITVLSNDEAELEVTDGPGGLAANLPAGAIHVSMSTISPALATRLQRLHVQYQNHYISSPVMGRPEMARARKLSFLVSGDSAVIERIEPLLTHAGAIKITRFGERPDAANTAKLCSNFLIASAIQSMAEGIHLAAKSGLDARDWLNMLTTTLFSSPIYQNYSNLLLNESFEPAAFSMNLGQKDLRLVLTQAATVDAEMPVATAVSTQLQNGIAAGMGDHDWTALSLLLK